MFACSNWYLYTKNINSWKKKVYQFMIQSHIRVTILALMTKTRKLSENVLMCDPTKIGWNVILENTLYVSMICLSVFTLKGQIAKEINYWGNVWGRHVSFKYLSEGVRRSLKSYRDLYSWAECPLLSSPPLCERGSLPSINTCGTMSQTWHSMGSSRSLVNPNVNSHERVLLATFLWTRSIL